MAFPITRLARMTRSLACLAALAASSVLAHTLQSFTCTNGGGAACSRPMLLDFNEDNIPDLIARQGNNVAVLLGNGMGGFAAQQNTAINADSTLVYGHSFLIYPEPGSNLTSLLTLSANTGARYGTLHALVKQPGGSFTVQQTPLVGNGLRGDPQLLAVYDLDGDGASDALVQSEAGSSVLEVWKSTGVGTYTRGQTLTLASGFVPVANVAAQMTDADRDSVRDIVLLAANNLGTQKLVVLRNNLDGTLTEQTLQRPDSASRPTLPTLHFDDFDQDGYPDLLSYDASTRQLLCYPGQAGLMLGTPVTTVVANASDPNETGIVSILGVNPDQYDLTDLFRPSLNADTYPDLFVTTTRTVSGVTSQRGTVWRNSGNCTFSRATDPIELGSSQGTLGFADFNDDNQPDVLLEGNRVLLLDPLLVALRPFALACQTVTHDSGEEDTSCGKALASDFDGDGKQDVVSFRGTTTFSVLTGNNQGTITLRDSRRIINAGDEYSFNQTWPAAIGGVTRPSFIAADGATLWAAVNEGSFSIRFVSTAIGSDASDILTVADLDRDGESDFLILRQDTATLEVWQGQGDGSFARGQSIALPAGFSLTVGSGSAQDMNNDGYVDLVLQVSGVFSGETRYALIVLQNNALGTVSLQNISRPDTSSRPALQGAVAGNFDRNTLPDIVSHDGHTVLCHAGQSGLSLAAPVVTDVTLGVVSLHVADLSSDGFPDLFLDHGSQATVWRNEGQCRFSLLTPVPVRLTEERDGSTISHRASSFADFNGDGQVDIVTTEDALLLLPPLAGQISAFSFTAQTGVPTGSTVTSNTITVSGATTATAISLAVGEFRINSGVWQNTPATVVNGDTVAVRVVASALNNSTVSTTLTIGTTLGRFSVSTGSTSAVDAFSFTPQTGVAPGSTVISNAITVGGASGVTVATLASGEFRINSGPWQNGSANVSNGDRIELRLVAAGFGLTVSTTLTVGTTAGSFNVSTATGSSPSPTPTPQPTPVAPIVYDATPDPFTFPPQFGMPRGSEVMSSIVRVSGIDTPINGSVNGGLMRINGGSWVTHGTVVPGDTVQLRVMAPGSFKEQASATLTLSNFSTLFVVSSEDSTAMTTSTSPVNQSTGNGVGAQLGIAQTFPNKPCASVAAIVDQPFTLDKLLLVPRQGNGDKPLVLGSIPLSANPLPGMAVLRAPSLENAGAVRISIDNAPAGTAMLAMGTCQKLNALWQNDSPVAEALFLRGEDGQLFVEVMRGRLRYVSGAQMTGSAGAGAGTTSLLVYRGETAALKADGSLDYIRLGSLNGRNPPDGGEIELKLQSAFATPNLAIKTPKLIGDVPDLSGGGLRIHNTALTKIDGVPERPTATGRFSLHDALGNAVASHMGWAYLPDKTSELGRSFELRFSESFRETLSHVLVSSKPIFVDPKKPAILIPQVKRVDDRIIQVDLGNMVVELEETVDLAMLSAELGKFSSTTVNAIVGPIDPINPIVANQINLIAAVDSTILNIYGRYYPVRLSTHTTTIAPHNCTNLDQNVFICEDSFVLRLGNSEGYSYKRLLPVFVRNSDAILSLKTYVAKQDELSNLNRVEVPNQAEHFFDGKFGFLSKAINLNSGKTRIFRPGFDVYTRPAGCNPENPPGLISGNVTDGSTYCIRNSATLSATSGVEIFLAQPYGLDGNKSSNVFVPGYNGLNQVLSWAQLAVPLDTTPLSEMFKLDSIQLKASQFGFAAKFTDNGETSASYRAVYFCYDSPSPNGASTNGRTKLVCQDSTGKFYEANVTIDDLKTKADFSSLLPWAVLRPDPVTDPNSCIQSLKARGAELGLFGSQPLDLTPLHSNMKLKGTVLYIGVVDTPVAPESKIQEDNKCMLTLKSGVPAAGRLSVLHRFP